MKNAFNKNVHPCKFSEGDIVLKKVSQAQKDHRGKWAPNYEGPFVVKKAFSGGALLLANMDDEELPLPVNFDICKLHVYSCGKIMQGLVQTWIRMMQLGKMVMG